MITFTVGNTEKHEVSFDYSTMTGAAKILVDGKEYSSSRIMFIGHTPFSLQVGDNEKHSVRIELDNPLFFAFRGSSVKAYVDEQLVRQDHVGGSIIMLYLIILIPIIVLLSFVISSLLNINR